MVRTDVTEVNAADEGSSVERRTQRSKVDVDGMAVDVWACGRCRGPGARRPFLNFAAR